MFIFTFHTMQLHDSPFLKFLGISHLFVVLFETLHIILYKNMGIISHPRTMDWSIAFHSLTDCLQAILFSVGLAFFTTRAPSLWVTVTGTGVPCLICVALVFSGYFPSCYNESSGIGGWTGFEARLDMSMALFLLVFSCVLLIRRRQIRTSIVTVFSVAVAMVALSFADFFLAFWREDRLLILYLGHAMKIASAYALYFGVLRVTFINPFQGLFLSLTTQRNELEHERNFVNTLIGHLPVGLVLFSRSKGKVLWTNEYLTSLIKMSEEQLNAQPWSQILFQIESPAMVEPGSHQSIFPVAPGRHGQEGEGQVEMDWIIQPLSVLDPQQTRLSFLVASDRDEAMVATGVDVTLANQARRMLLTQHDVLDRLVRERTADLEAALAELRQRTTDLAAARDSAESAARAKTTFLNSMSHELRTPLTAILGCSELLQDSLHMRDVQEATLHAASIRESGQRLLDTVNGVLDMARFESGRFPLHLESLDAVSVVRKALGLLAPLALKKGLRLALRTNCHQLTVTSDPSGLQHIINNLVGNSIKVRLGHADSPALPCRCVWAAGQFTTEGHVEVRILRASAEPQWIIEVEVCCLMLPRTPVLPDTGCGMSADFRKRIFQPFSQESEGSTRRYDGSGLGLSLVRMYVSVLGGSIDVTSQRGKGTTFHILLPLISVPTLGVPSPSATRSSPGVRTSDMPRDHATVLPRLSDEIDLSPFCPTPPSPAGLGLVSVLALPAFDPPSFVYPSHEAFPSPTQGDSCLCRPRPSRSPGPILRALVVEDNLPCALVCRRFLAPIFGSVDVAHSPDEAMALLAQDQDRQDGAAVAYAMVFMDIDLGHPAIDGVSLLRLIRTRFPAMEAVPALATTAHILQADRDELMQTGLFAEVVGKPYSRELLLETAQRHLPKQENHHRRHGHRPPRREQIPKMGRKHSRNQCSNPIFSHEENKKIKYKSQEMHIGSESLKNFDDCGLCLQPVREPLCCPQGHLYCKSCIYESLLTQKQTIEQKQKDFETQSRILEAKRKAKEDEDRAAAIATFEAIETGIHHVVMVADKKHEAPKPLLDITPVTPPASSTAPTATSTSVTTPPAAPSASPRTREEEAVVLPIPEGVPVVRRVDPKPRDIGNNFWLVCTGTHDPTWRRLLCPEGQEAKLTPPSKQTVCPVSVHPGPCPIKQLFPVNFTESKNAKREGKSYQCPVCLSGLTNAHKAHVLRTCGHVFCRTCVALLRSPAAAAPAATIGTTPDPPIPATAAAVSAAAPAAAPAPAEQGGRCYVCDVPFKAADVVPLEYGGTGFAAHGGQVLIHKDAKIMCHM
ncbi:putative two-component sensor histidine kinase BarA [Paratrimastix pyriformis]|uniref:histidine kinase n=1 Tax=Paratrimastix pyriformis TaxID=342808 RepID=A0ABQ8UNP8_9EUKA|nr:putative two-component sensor histidine kinase BarA [Paratrimastix pyriformis]